MSDPCGATVFPEEAAATPVFVQEGTCVVPGVEPRGNDPDEEGEEFTDPDPIGAPPELNVGPREFLADFDTLTHVKQLATLTRRPDAVAPDYLIAHTMGPVNIGDPFSGARNRPWRASVHDNGVWIARANDAMTAWEAETLLFSYLGEPIVEMDVAFEQLARVVVAAERANEIWIYWFDPILGDFIFQNFGEGRNPRCLLDNPNDPAESDVIVFYFSDI